MHGKCPKCEQIVSRLALDTIDATFSNGNGFKAVSLMCPMCNTVLGAQIDPIALKTDTIEGTIEEMQKRGIIR